MPIAELDRALAASERVLLDSSTLIAFHNPAEATHVLADHLLRRIGSDDDPLRGYYSTVSAAELLIRPIRSSREDFTFMHTFLTQFPNLLALPMDMIVAVQAASLRAASSISLPDAMVIASGLLAGCEAIVTNDGRWRRFAATFPRFRWVFLAEHS